MRDVAELCDILIRWCDIVRNNVEKCEMVVMDSTESCATVQDGVRLFRDMLDGEEWFRMVRNGVG